MVGKERAVLLDCVEEGIVQGASATGEGRVGQRGVDRHSRIKRMVSLYTLHDQVQQHGKMGQRAPSDDLAALDDREGRP